MATKKFIAETRYTDMGPIIRTCTRKAVWTDYIPAIILFIGIVWRKWDEGYRISAPTAWSVAKSVHDIQDERS